MTNLDSNIKKKRHHFADKVPYSQSYSFSSQVWMWELDHKKWWVLKNWCFWTLVLERTHRSPLDSKEIKPVYPKGNQPWIFIGRTDAEAEALVLWPPDVKSWLLEKDSNSGKDRRQEEKGVTEDEMVGYYHWLNRHDSIAQIRFEQTPGGSEGQGSLGSQRVRHNWVTEQEQNKPQWLNTAINICYLHSNMGQECGSIFWLGPLMKLPSSCQPGPLSPEGLTGAGESHLRLLLMPSKLGLIVGERPQFIPHGGLFTGCLSVLTAWQLAFLRVIQEKEKSHPPPQSYSFYGPTSKIT